MSNESWELVPHKGIEKSDINVFFGMERVALNSILRKQFGPPKSFRSDEDWIGGWDLDSSSL